MIEKVQRAIVNGPTYVVLYIFFMIPTYVLPYIGSNSLVGNAVLAVADQAAGGGNGFNTGFLAHLICLSILCFIAWLRGGFVGKQWIVIFPILASLFDLTPGFSLIPLVPTAFHIAVIIVGVSSEVKRPVE